MSSPRPTMCRTTRHSGQQLIPTTNGTGTSFTFRAEDEFLVREQRLKIRKDREKAQLAAVQAREQVKRDKQKIKAKELRQRREAEKATAAREAKDRAHCLRQLAAITKREAKAAANATREAKRVAKVAARKATSSHGARPKSKPKAKAQSKAKAQPNAKAKAKGKGKGKTAEQQIKAASLPELLATALGLLDQLGSAVKQAGPPSVPPAPVPPARKARPRPCQCMRVQLRRLL
jgi:thiol:disulfide interchange protein